MNEPSDAMNVGVLVPCRNEERVIGRKLLNLLQLHWPAGLGSLRLLVVDDHSTDQTVERAQAHFGGALPDNVRLELIHNDVRPGKNGAIECGLAHLGQELDFVVLTDADVLVDSGALVSLCAAFRADPKLGMVCGTQVFVDALPGNGCALDAERGALADDRWDRLTRGVRRLESRFGMLFSVHGQWLAWRADLGVQPAEGVAADDVDLMIQVRASRRPRVRMLSEVQFYEGKPAAGEALDVQALRRARAWFQVFARPQILAGWRGLGFVQGQLYRFLPGAAPSIALLCCVLSILVGSILWGMWGALAASSVLAVLLLSSAGRAWVRTLRLIHQAQRLERQAAMGEAWEMGRE